MSKRQVVNGVDQIDNYAVSPTLLQLCEVYKFWIALADLDGFRLDTVKHIDPGAARFFANVIHEFTEASAKTISTSSARSPADVSLRSIAWRSPVSMRPWASPMSVAR